MLQHHPHCPVPHLGGNLFVVLLIRLYPTWELEPPTVPVRFGKKGITMEIRSGQLRQSRATTRVVI